MVDDVKAGAIVSPAPRSISRLLNGLNRQNTRTFMSAIADLAHPNLSGRAAVGCPAN